MKFVFDLHRRLPYFDLVGWDIALDVNNEPVFIEMKFENGSRLMMKV